MDGGDGFNNNADDSDDGADAFEAALQPLPTWDGLSYSTNRGNTENDILWGTRYDSHSWWSWQLSSYSKQETCISWFSQVLTPVRVYHHALTVRGCRLCTTVAVQIV